MLQIHFAALVLAATALMASGCGSSSKTESTTTTAATTAPTTTTGTTPTSTATAITVATGKPLTRTTWIARGDKICARTAVKLKVTKAKTPQELARVLPLAAGYDRIEATELSKLVPPTEMASDWGRIVTGIQKFSEYTVKAGEYAQANNFNNATPIIKAGETTKKQVQAIAKQDGFKVCSKK